MLKLAAHPTKVTKRGGRKDGEDVASDKIGKDVEDTRADYMYHWIWLYCFFFICLYL